MESTQQSTGMNEAATMLPPATGSSQINLTNAERTVSTVGGVALTLIGLKKLNTLSGVGLLLGGGFLLSRGLSGYCALTNYLKDNVQAKHASAMEVEKSFTIESPRSTVYAFWRKLENLPQFMRHLESVSETDDKTSTWTAKLPGNVGKVSWQAEILEDISGERISWNSLPGSTVDNAGEVVFKDANDGSATELHVRMSYRLPGGDIGSLAGKLFSPAVEKMMHDDIESFKRLMETGNRPASGERGDRRSGSTIATDEESKVFGVS